MAEPYPWQTAVWQHLGRLEVAARLPHAIFFVGSPGLGKREFARLFAHRLLCESPDPDARPCCACRACRLFTSGLHPDFHEVGLEGKHSVIRVDQIRALIEFVTLTSQQSGRKIACVQDAERMNPSAANSFLKTLEEPPDDTLLLLASDSAQRLPATIRSRCQLIRFSKPNRATGLRWLADQGVTESGELLLDLADNAPLRARALADGSGLARRQALFEQFALLLRGARDPIGLAAEWHTENSVEILRHLLGWTQDLLRLSVARTQTVCQSSDLAVELQRISNGLSPDALFGLLSRTEKMLQLSETSVSKQLGFEDLLIDWTQVVTMRDEHEGN